MYYGSISGAAMTANCTGRAAEWRTPRMGVTLQLDKNAQTAGPLNCYAYLLMDAQLNIGDGRLISSMF